MKIFQAAFSKVVKVSKEPNKEVKDDPWAKPKHCCFCSSYRHLLSFNVTFARLLFLVGPTWFTVLCIKQILNTYWFFDLLEFKLLAIKL